MPSDRESSEQMEPMKREGVLLEDHIPETRSHPKDIKHKAKRYLLCRLVRPPWVLRRS